MSPDSPGAAAAGGPRILHVCDSIIGGTGSYLAELLTLQAARHGGESIMLLMPRQHIDHIEPRLADSGIRFAYFNRPSRFVGMLVLLFAYLVQRRRFRPDIVHAHSFGAGVSTRIVHWFRRPRMIFCPHGWAFNIPLGRGVRRIIVAIERVLALRTDRILLISNHEQKSAEAVGMPADKLVTIPNAIATEPPAIAAAPWDDARIKLLFVGRFDRQKGLDLLIDAIRPLGHKFALRVVGSPVVGKPANFGPSLDFVDFIGWRPRDGVSGEMKAADAVVIPSRWEGFGLVATEAMRLGKPVIASDAGGLSDILDDGRYGITFPAGDGAALRAVLERLDPATLATYGPLGHARFLAEYRMERMIDDVDELYRSVLRD